MGMAWQIANIFVICADISLGGYLSQIIIAENFAK